MRARRALLGLATIVLVGALGTVLLQRKPRQAGSNYVAEAAYVQTLFAGQRLCDRPYLIPGRAASVRLGVLPRKAGPVRLSVTVRRHGYLITAGSSSGPPVAGHMVIPLRTVARTVAFPRVCIANTGAVPVSLAGQRSPVNLARGKRLPKA